MFRGVNLSLINIHSCRVCLKTVCENGVLLDQNSELLKLFEYCTDLSILPQDKAKTICKKCALKIKSYAKFKRKCLEANEIWKSFTVENEKNCTQTFTEIHKLLPVALDKETNDNLSDIEKYPTTYNVKIEVLCDVIDNSCEFDDKCSKIDDVKTENVIVKERIEISTVNNNFSNEEYLLDETYIDEAENQQLSKRIENTSHKHIKVKKKVHKIKCLKPKEVTTPTVPVQKVNFCGLCNYTSTSSVEIKEHLGEHWSNNNSKCNICDFTGQDSADLFTHRYTHHPNGETVKFYFCHICEKKCASSHSLEFHYRSVHLQKPGGFCSQCRRTFKIFSTWKKHERLHRLERFICDHCGKKFLYRNQIEGHLVDHGDTRNYMCEECGKSFKRKFGLKTHLTTVHSSESIKCSHCDKIFKSQVTYKDHIRGVKSEKPFTCVHCGKSYRLESALRAHMFWHSGERPHVCDVCGVKYKSKGQLKVHKRNHTGYMPFKCRECDKCFTNSPSLKRHQSVHTGKRAHKCGYCERTFHGKKPLEEHVATTHKDKMDVKLENT
ncbi:uncharacterized protein [Epargyreus clarus]|uniref:uncharacterized protein n=1 Tax=Epargyreus clarus TaxID=520877 RepID=UPI003C2B9CAA